MSFTALLDSLVPVLGEMGVKALADKLENLSAGQGESWKRMVLALVADAVEAHGPAGVEMAYQAIKAIFDNKKPKIDWASPRTASDIVAAMQNAEADRKSEVKDFFVQLGEVFSLISVGIVRGLIKG